MVLDRHEIEKERDEEDEPEDNTEENILSAVSELSNKLDTVSWGIEWLSKEDLIWQLKEMDMEWFFSHLETTVEKFDKLDMLHSNQKDNVDKFNDRMLELKVMISNLFTRLNQK